MNLSRQKSYLSRVESSESDILHISSGLGHKSKSLRIRGSSFKSMLSKTPSFKLEVSIFIFILFFI